MLALLFRHGVELPIPGSTKASLEVAGLWHRSHLRALREPWELLHLPSPGQAQPAPAVPLLLLGLMEQGSLSSVNMMIHDQTYPGLLAAAWE